MTTHAATGTATGKRIASAADDGGGGAMTAARDFGRASLDAVATIYASMDQAISIVCADSIDATSELVQLRYGEEAGEVTKEGMNAAKNVLDARKAVTKVNAKSVIKTAGKSAAAATLDTSVVKEREAAKK